MVNRKSNYKGVIKKYLANLTLSLLTILVCLLISEYFLRIFYKDRFVLFPRYATDAKYGEYRIRRLRPDLEFWHTGLDGSWKFTTNSKGFRSDDEFNYSKRHDVLRIISLGDSHTQGLEARQDYTYSLILEKYLRNSGYKAEVFNMGIAGFSTAEELVLLENEGIKYKPDFVVLGFYANDFEDNMKADLFELNNGELKVKNKEHIPGVRILKTIYKIPFISYLSENSYLYSVLFNTIWDYYRRALYSKKNAQLSIEFAIPTEELTDHKMLLATRLIERMYSFCKRNNVSLIILDIPQIGDEGFRSSFPGEMHQTIEENSDIFVKSEETLEDYNKIAEIHRPHGWRHISEFTHTVLGVAIGKEIILSMQ